METILEKDVIPVTRLAKAAGISRSHLSNLILHPDKWPAYEVAKALEKATGINHETWLNREDKSKINIKQALGMSGSATKIQISSVSVRNVFLKFEFNVKSKIAES